MADFIQPQYASEAITVPNVDYTQLSGVISRGIGNISQYLEQEREKNRLFVEQMNFKLEQIPIKDMPYFQEQVDALRDGYANDMAKFNFSLAAPRNKAEREARAKYDAMMTDIMQNAKYSAAMNPIFEEQRAYVMANQDKFGVRAIEFFSDPQTNYYDKAPLDRVIPAYTERPDINPMLAQLAKGSYKEKSKIYPGYDGIITENYGYIYDEDAPEGSSESLDYVANNIALNPMLNAGLDWEYQDYLDTNMGNLDVMSREEFSQAYVRDWLRNNNINALAKTWKYKPQPEREPFNWWGFGNSDRADRVAFRLQETILLQNPIIEGKPDNMDVGLWLRSEFEGRESMTAPELESKGFEYLNINNTPYLRVPVDSKSQAAAGMLTEPGRVEDAFYVIPASMDGIDRYAPASGANLQLAIKNASDGNNTFNEDTGSGNYTLIDLTDEQSFGKIHGYLNEPLGVNQKVTASDIGVIKAVLPQNFAQDWLSMYRAGTIDYMIPNYIRTNYDGYGRYIGGSNNTNRNTNTNVSP